MIFTRFSTLTLALHLVFISTTVVRGDLALSLVPSSSSFVEGTSGYVDVFINGDTGTRSMRS